MPIVIKVMIPVWLLVSALVVAFTGPSGMATGLLLLISGLAAAAILFLGKNAVQQPVFDGVPTIDVTPLSAWPDSGFRNIGRGTKGG